jgi:hypothetical protein
MIKRKQINDMAFATIERKLDSTLDLSQDTAEIIEEQLFNALKKNGLENLIHSFWGIYFLVTNEKT